jgi:hypothetical protein
LKDSLGFTKEKKQIFEKCKKIIKYQLDACEIQQQIQRIKSILKLLIKHLIEDEEEFINEARRCYLKTTDLYCLYSIGDD